MANAETVETKLPCPSTECGSSDAFTLYTDHGYCFSCQKYFKLSEIADSLLEEYGLSKGTEKAPKPETKAPVTDLTTHKELQEIVNDYDCRGLAERRIQLATAEHYGIRVGYSDTGVIDTHYYLYYDKHGEIARPTGTKVRQLPKKFWSIGDTKTLYGKWLFQPGGKKIIITEGEVDCLTVAQAQLHHYNRFYPVVSIPNGVNADKVLKQELRYLRSFETVVLMFDQDEVGREAAQKAAKIIGVSKCRIATYPAKDPNELLLKHGSDSTQMIMQAIWNAEEWRPSGMLTPEQMWEAYITEQDKPSVPYPPCLTALNSVLKGIRLNEITLFISGTGSGKSLITREIALHLCDIGEKVAIISLEENVGITLKNLIAMYLRKNPAETVIEKDEAEVAFDELCVQGNIVVYDHNDTEDRIIDAIDYYSQEGYMIIIDHITLWASEDESFGAYANENAKIDRIMSQLRKLAAHKDHGTHYFLVSQLRKSNNTQKSFEDGVLPSMDDIKGSGSIKQICHNIVAAARNLQAPDPLERNTLKMASLKCRYTGNTGPLPEIYYSHESNRLYDQPPLEYLMNAVQQQELEESGQIHTL